MSLWFKFTARCGIAENTPFNFPLRFYFLKHTTLVTQMQRWLMKSEPGEFSIDDLKASPRQTGMWDGVRNYQARNMIRDSIKEGDLAFFYHSACDVPGIVGVMEVVKEAYADPTAFEPDDKHFDPKSDPKDPRWFVVDLKFKCKLKRTISLAELKTYEQLGDMRLLQRGNRLSVMPVAETEWDFILALE